MSKKLIVVDSGNIMHKSIFAVIAQIQSEMKKIVVEKGIDDFDSTIFDDLWYDIFDTLETKQQNREVFIMNPTTTYLKMLIGYFKRIGVTQDDLVVIAEDYGSWRKSIDKEYKAQRAALRENKMPDTWWKEQYTSFNEFLDELKIAVPWLFCKVYKCESDDIASVAVRFVEADEKIMISSDEDWQMLCSIPNTKIFSPYTKKYKIVKNPSAILAKKRKGDISDNLLTEPQTEEEWNKRDLIVNLLKLPKYVEDPIREILLNSTPRPLCLNKIRYRGCRTELQKLYKI